MGDLMEIGEVLNIPLDSFIAFAVNNCGYSEPAHDMMINYVHTLFLKEKSESRKEDNPNCWQDMNGPSVYEYWKSYCNYI